jgi:hypothetical protein
MKLHRLTFLVFAFPNYYVDNDPEFWGDINIIDWSFEFDWEKDDWNGMKDIATKPRTTFSSKAGDCEDYALVAASWCVSNNRSGVGLGFCFDRFRAEHVIAFDDERIYSSGVIRDETPEEYIRDSDYDRVIRRGVVG